MKLCPDCGETKALTDYHSDRSRPDGRSGFCKECRKRRAREWNRKNKERKAESSRRWYEENTERHQAKHREWCRNNPEALRVHRRRALERFKERDPLGYALKHRAEVKGRRLSGIHREYGKIVACDPCSYCGGPGGTLDHIDPIVTGGANDWQNLTGACHSCNSRKREVPLLLALLTRL
jgi:hypothetical protein